MTEAAAAAAATTSPKPRSAKPRARTVASLSESARIADEERKARTKKLRDKVKAEKDAKIAAQGFIPPPAKPRTNVNVSADTSTADPVEAARPANAASLDPNQMAPEETTSPRPARTPRAPKPPRAPRSTSSKSTKSTSRDLGPRIRAPRMVLVDLKEAAAIGMVTPKKLRKMIVARLEIELAKIVASAEINPWSVAMENLSAGIEQMASKIGSIKESVAAAERGG